MINKTKKRKLNLTVAKDAQNRAIALSCFIALNIAAIFSDSIVAQFKDSIITGNNSQKIKEIADNTIEIEHLEYSGIKELAELQEKYDKLNAKYETLEDKISNLQNSQNSSHIIISYFKLQKKIKQGKDYQDNLALTKSLINNDSKLYEYFLEFEKLLQQKIKTNNQIIQDFDQIINQIKSNDNIKDSDNIIDKIKNNILNQIVIRKINFDQEEENNIDYLIHKIELNLKSKNYQKALNYINKIEGESLSPIKIDLTNLIQFQKINKKIIKLFG